MNCIFIQEKDVVGNCIYIHHYADLAHILNSCRFKIGQVLYFKDQRYCYKACLNQIVNKQNLLFSILSRRPLKLPSLKIVLCQALINQKGFCFSLQKATELGVGTIVPFYSERTQINVLFDDVPKKHRRWTKIVQEASKQCNRDFVPTIFSKIVSLEDLGSFSGIKIVAYEEETQFSFKDRLDQISLCKGDEIVLCVGPEGGFAPIEIQKLLRLGFLSCSLTSSLLKSETAALFMLSNLFFSLDFEF